MDSYNAASRADAIFESSCAPTPLDVSDKEFHTHHKSPLDNIQGVENVSEQTKNIYGDSDRLLARNQGVRSGHNFFD